MKISDATATIGLRRSAGGGKPGGADPWFWVWGPPFVAFIVALALFVLLSPFWVGGTLVVRAWQRAWVWDAVPVAAAAGLAWLVLFRVQRDWNGPSWLRRLRSIAGWSHLAALPLAFPAMLGAKVGLVPIALAVAGVLWKVLTEPSEVAKPAAPARQAATHTTRP
ncbi:MAG TPA: hypothetical protein VFS92_04930 [Planctomycetota bacterium]|nr:hypothetical protein [Planctomycetota bacterium]